MLSRADAAEMAAGRDRFVPYGKLPLTRIAHDWASISWRRMPTSPNAMAGCWRRRWTDPRSARTTTAWPGIRASGPIWPARRWTRSPNSGRTPLKSRTCGSRSQYLRPVDRICAMLGRGEAGPGQRQPTGEDDAPQTLPRRRDGAGPDSGDDGHCPRRERPGAFREARRRRRGGGRRRPAARAGQLQEHREILSSFRRTRSIRYWRRSSDWASRGRWRSSTTSCSWAPSG